MDLLDSAFQHLKNVLDSYYRITPSTLEIFHTICSHKQLEKNQTLYSAGTIPDSFAFIHSGLLRAYTTDNDGNAYNKNFFTNGSFPGSMSALLTKSSSNFTIDALEASQVIIIDYKKYREILYEKNDLKLFHIHYLERNWLLEKDSREIEIIQNNASQRYIKFLRENESISSRIPQYHIASHLGITPTQLSRIKKDLNNQPM